MRIRRLLVLASCFLVSVLGASAVKAGGAGTAASGTIAFVGALVEPTCATSAASDLLDAAIRPAAGSVQSYRRRCSGPASAPAHAARTYHASVAHLSRAEPDQVLRYFAGYVRAARPGGADPVLLTQTYE
jgi:hypothetical protein